MNLDTQVETYGVYTEVPLRAVRPAGWLRGYLEKQRDGLTGHMEKAGYPFNVSFWGAPPDTFDAEEHWSRFEQTAYWIDGAIRCGHLLEDDQLIAKAAAEIEGAIAHAADDGFIGPRATGRWPHAVFFRALMAHHGATDDDSLVDAVRRHYLADRECGYDRGREVCNVEAMLWAADIDDDPVLRGAALRAYTAFSEIAVADDASPSGMASDSPITEHGVTFNEIAKLAALVYMCAGDPDLLKAVRSGYRKLSSQSELASGLHSCSEHIRGNDPLDSHETCDISDHAWALSCLLMASGKAEYADRIERVCFNAGPGAVKSDFTALQYFSCPNQVLATSDSNHNRFFRGEPWMAYRPNPSTECCPGNVNRFMPNYVSRMWMRDRDEAPVAVLFGPSRMEVSPGFVIHEETRYPFEDTVVFRFEVEKTRRVPFSFRIPGWCRDVDVRINGKPGSVAGSPGSFLTLDKEWADGDRVELQMDIPLRMRRWPRGGVSLERGPLVFSLRIDEDWQELPATARKQFDPRYAPGVEPELLNPADQFPVWDVLPSSAWNYAIDVDRKSLNDDIEVVRDADDVDDPWTADTAPIRLVVPVRRVEGWAIEECDEVEEESPKEDQGWKYTVTRKTGHFRFTPQLPDPQDLPGRLSSEQETVTFVPYGCTHLRLTVLPSARQ